ITQEQFILASHSLHLQRPGCDAVYPVGLCGWRKRCIYFFLLLLFVTMIVNLALTVWIMKVMNFSVDGMGKLQLNQDGLHLEGLSEFQMPLYVTEIKSRRGSSLLLRSDKNVTLNARNNQGQLTGQLSVGPESVEAQCQRLEVRSRDSRNLLFSAEEEEVTMTAEKFTVTGSEGAVFGHSVETPLIQARPSEDLNVAPSSGKNSALCLNSNLPSLLILLDANSIQLGSLPLGVYASSTSQDFQQRVVYEVCVCPSGKMYLSPAESISSCQAMSSICLWS
uniref:Sarcoglycan zeta n=1 Tax=Nothobranchius furzeri TaxID=105023 RepID=A0A8C6K6D0_NOTFU